MQPKGVVLSNLATLTWTSDQSFTDGPQFWVLHSGWGGQTEATLAIRVENESQEGKLGTMINDGMLQSGKI